VRGNLVTLASETSYFLFQPSVLFAKLRHEFLEFLP
jgi:hypothetical protein